MAISLVCPCGARLYLDDAMAGHEVQCPDCQQKLKAPGAQQVVLRTDTLALVSVILALAGAVTLVGTIAAVLVGCIALVRILTNRERLAGIGFACFGIVAGSLFTALTVFAIRSGSIDDWSGRLREQMLAESVDTSGPLTIRQPANGFQITRPSDKWGVTVRPIDDVVVTALNNGHDLQLVQTVHYAFVDVKKQSAPPNKTINQCADLVLDEFTEYMQSDPWAEFDEDVHPTSAVRISERAIPAPLNAQGQPAANVQGRELEVDVRCGNQTWRFLIHVFLTQNSSLYVVRGYAQRRRFDAAEDELRQTMNSFRLLAN